MTRLDRIRERLEGDGKTAVWTPRSLTYADATYLFKIAVAARDLIDNTDYDEDATRMTALAAALEDKQ